MSFMGLGLSAAQQPGGGFVPTQLQGLVLWLRADLGVTIVQGPVTATGTTPPAVTFAGTPASSTNTIVLTCTGTGTLGVATFSWTLNGVAQTPFTSAASVVLTGSGITATMPAGTYTAGGTPDVYTSVVTVSAWADQSGNGYNSSQGTATKQPALTAADAFFNNWPTLSYVSASIQLLQTGSFAVAQTITIIVAGTATGTGTIVGDVNGTVAMYTQGGTLRGYAGTVLSSASTPSSPAVMAVVLSGGSSAVYLNSSSVPVAGPGAGGANNMAGGIQLGDNGIAGALQGKQAEVIVLSTASPPSAATLHQIFVYLGARYGIAAS